MELVFINYTSLYYTYIAETTTPLMINGKFVLIQHESTEYLVFSPAAFTKYHANIVERFCLDKGIEGGYNAEGKVYNISDHAWIIAGGGKFEIDTLHGTLKLFDESMAYGKFNGQGLQEKILSLPAFTGYTVLIN